MVVAPFPDVMPSSIADGATSDPKLEEIAPTIAVATSVRDSSFTISKSVNQKVHLCATHKKPRLLIKYLERLRAEEKSRNERQPGSVLIFCTKIKTLNYVVDFLRRHGLKVESIHGQLQQSQVKGLRTLLTFYI